MRGQQTGYILAVAWGLAATGCAPLGLGPPRIVDERTIDAASEPVRRAGAATAAVEQNGTVATIRARRACVEDQRLLRTVQRTQERERVNQSPLADLAYGVFGATSLAVGAWWTASPRSIATSTLSPKEASGLGVSFVSIGVALLAIPAIDAALASGSEREVTTARMPGGLVRKDTSCGDLPYPGAEIATVVQGKPVGLGVTDDAGILQLDLMELPTSLAVGTEPRARLFLGATEFGSVDLEPLRRVKQACP